MPGTAQSGSFADLRLRVYRILEDMAALDSITSDVPALPAGGTININVNDATQWPVNSRFEIDDEQFLITVNTGGNPITVSRAYMNTYAAFHKAGSLARRNPRFERTTVNEAINIVLGNWLSFYIPQLVWDETTAGSFTPIRWIYKVPADTLAVRRVVWQIPGFFRYVDVDHTELGQYPISQTDTGYGFEIKERIGLPGRAVICLLEKRWPTLVNDFDSVPTDFPPEADDLIVIGAALYIAGIRQIPRWRMDEITFYREQNVPIPSHFNDAWLKSNHDKWYRRARQIAAKRPNPSGQKVYVGSVQ
jgi:hypothetical protein